MGLDNYVAGCSLIPVLAGRPEQQLAEKTNLHPRDIAEQPGQ